VTWPDYAILGTITISILVGALRGFIKEVFSLLVWAAAFIIAYQYGGDIAALMENHISLPSARTAMGFTGLFIVVLLIGGLLNYLLGRLVESTGLSGTDRLLGGVFGTARGLALVVAVLLVAGFTPIPADPWWKDAQLIQRMMPFVEWSSGFLPENVREHLDFDPQDLPANQDDEQTRAAQPEAGTAQRKGENEEMEKEADENDS
jgi:membrane protein required for colicin V production